MDKKAWIYFLITVLVMGVFLTGAFTGLVWTGFLLSALFGIGSMWLIFHMNKEELNSSSSKKMIATFLTVLTVSSISIFAFSYVRADFQKETLRNVRLNINESIIHVQVKATLFDVYRTYSLSEEPKLSIVEIALEKFGDKIEAGNSMSDFFEDSEKEFDFKYEVNEEADEFIVFVISKTTFGENHDFENVNDSTGRHQVKLILSENGVSYDRQN